MATVKKYNLAGLNANVELGKRGSYITGGSDEIGFYANGGTLQKLKIADATVATEAVTKSQLDLVAADLIHHVTLDFDYDSGSSNIATIAAGTRIISVTVDIPSAWTASNNTATFVEVGDSDNASRFIRAGDVDILKVAQYHSQFQYEYSAETVMTLAVTQGTASAGAGTVSLVLAGESTVTDYGSITSSQNSNNDLGDITT
jgi:hypothetical protein|tara:strand:+ start:1255 stop:1860 length:606 start_codon:yes stop_codon:yes gene_type:complete